MNRALFLPVALLLALPARADAPGLFAEAHTAIDGVTVRRVRDTSNGVVCYVATGFVQGPTTAGGELRGRSAAISCIRVPQ